MNVVAVGELRTAGNFKKQYFTTEGENGRITGFVWVRPNQPLNLSVGDIADGNWTFKESNNPAYEGEQVFIGKFIKTNNTQPAAPSPSGQPQAAATMTVKDIQITRQNACNVAANIMSGKGTEDIGKFWAMVRQVQHYTSTGNIMKMSTKEQHAAILAMFGKDVDKAREAVEKAVGYPYLDAMTYDEAVSFLAIETHDLPS